MTTAYTPKIGDRVRLVREGVVEQLDTKLVRIGGPWFSTVDSYFELVEAAPIPFEVGKPLTKEMGEPPVGSVVRFPVKYDLAAYERGPKGWHGTGTELEMVWSDFRSALATGTLTLLHLGESK